MNFIRIYPNLLKYVVRILRNIEGGFQGYKYCVFFHCFFQVVCLALFYAIVIRQPDTDSDINRNPNLKKDEEYLHKQYKEKDINDPEALKAIQQYRTVVPVPPDEEFLREAREERFVFM